MIALTQSPASLVAESLEPLVAQLEEIGPQRWKFRLTDQETSPGSARLVDDWLHLRMPVEHGIESEALDWLLARNGTLPGLSKFALAETGPALCLAAELPVGDEVGFAEWLRASVDGFTEGMAALGGEAASPIAEPPPVEAAIDLAALCRETGWPHVVRPSGTIAIDLDVPHAFHQAVLQNHADHGLRVSVDLGAVGNVSSISLQAIGTLLLAAAGVVRMARPVLERPGEKLSAEWQVSLGEAATAQQLRHALAALSVACRVCARELKLLEDESIANAYLRVRGWSAPRISE